MVGGVWVKREGKNDTISRLPILKINLYSFMNATHLVLKSINQLFDYSFFIPAYQRGYRWNKLQVEQLLDDIWHFAKNPPIHEPGQEKPFYCLQPVVVKKHKERENEWEVIDGQQRLTTLYLIIKNLKNQIERDKKNFTRISYETRILTSDIIGSEEYLCNIENNTHLSSYNIDFFHMHKAYTTIHDWFQEKANTTEDVSPRALITPILLRDTKVIWYEADSNENNDSVDIFTRLNIGKIPLTNSELIKALFLKRVNFIEENASIKQIQIANEWDAIEKALQDDSFWYFIYNTENPIKYDNRIEYVFDLMMDRNKDSEYYHTFNEFYKEFSTNLKDNKPNIDDIWLKIKRFFLTFEEWYKDYELYHYVGYLICCGISINAIKKESKDKPKDIFKETYLKNEIRKQVKCNIDELEYPDKQNKQIKKVLLLFNIQTVLETHKSDMRFPFYKYKTEDWDIEHVRSQTERDIVGNKRHSWINDILDYFNDSNATPAEENYETLECDDEAILICQSLNRLKNSEKIDDGLFDETFKRVQNYFKEGNQTEEINNISNLALLNSATNRSYGNSFFPIKRLRIIHNDSKGIFVPIATKNLFLKYYSRKFGDVMYWNTDDAGYYLDAIKSTLVEFLPKEDVI